MAEMFADAAAGSGGGGAGMGAAEGLSMFGSVFGNLFKGITGFLSSNEQAHAYSLEQHQDKLLAGVNAGEAVGAGDAVAARAATQAAANGGGLGGGASGMGLIAEASARAMFNGRAQIYRGLTEANSALYNESVAKDNGVNSLIGGALGATSSAAADYSIDQSRQQMLQAFSASHGEAQDPFYGLQ